jgi:hypothetical protein
VDKLRFPIATLLAGTIVSVLFGALHAASNVRATVSEALALSKVEFVRLRTSMEIEEKKREKPQIEKPEQAPVSSDPRAEAAATARAAARWPSVRGCPTAIRCRWCASSLRIRRRRRGAASRAGCTCASPSPRPARSRTRRW